ncbi:MAG: hypothetical protein D6776_09680, partial [Planctomycetota bacterium]
MPTRAGALTVFDDFDTFDTGRWQTLTAASTPIDPIDVVQATTIDGASALELQSQYVVNGPADQWKWRGLQSSAVYTGASWARLEVRFKTLDGLFNSVAGLYHNIDQLLGVWLFDP